jgi:phosphatidylglycerol---prolipoprotein diacylglyceryl transferase
MGCFLAGCCYGTECHDSLLAVTFTNPDGIAPLNIPLYPTQLYLGFTSFLIFVVLFLFRNVLKNGGQITFSYLCLDSLARFFIDFYRGDRGDLVHFNFLRFDLYFSEIQVWVLIVFIVSLVALLVASLYKKAQ